MTILLKLKAKIKAAFKKRKEKPMGASATAKANILSFNWDLEDCSFECCRKYLIIGLTIGLLTLLAILAFFYIDVSIGKWVLIGAIIADILALLIVLFKK